MMQKRQVANGLRLDFISKMPEEATQTQKDAKAVVDLNQQRHVEAEKKCTLNDFYGSALQEVEAQMAFNDKLWDFGEVAG